MPPGGGVGITSIARETSLPDLIQDARFRGSKLGKASFNAATSRRKDAAVRAARPHLFFDSMRHIQAVDEARRKDATFCARLKPSMSAPSVSSIAKSSAGSSMYIEVLKKQWGMEG